MKYLLIILLLSACGTEHRAKNLGKGTIEYVDLNGRFYPGDTVLQNETRYVVLETKSDVVYSDRLKYLIINGYKSGDTVYFIETKDTIFVKKSRNYR